MKPNPAKLTSIPGTLDYYSTDNHYWLQRCLKGYDVYELNEEGAMPTPSAWTPSRSSG